MKTCPKLARVAFSLIELLVVIAVVEATPLDSPSIFKP